MMMNTFLIGTLSQYSFMFWGVWMTLSIILYLTYGEWVGMGHHVRGQCLMMDLLHPPPHD